MEEVEEETVGIIMGMSGGLYRITNSYGITGYIYWLLIDNSRMLGNSYGITGYILAIDRE